jgi:hypothetical protein
MNQRQLQACFRVERVDDFISAPGQRPAYEFGIIKDIFNHQNLCHGNTFTGFFHEQKRILPLTFVSRSL